MRISHNEIKMPKRAIITLISVFFITASLAAQDSLIRVSSVTIDIQNGNTRENAVRKWIEVTEGSEFSNEESLQSRVNSDVQELTNLRVFQSVEASIRPDPFGQENDRIVEIRIMDASTFVPVPLPLYDSNTGGLQLLYVQIWDNMFGSLTNWFSLATLTIRPGDDGKIETGPWIFAPQVSNIKAGNLVFGVRFEQERVESSRYSGNSLVSSYRYDRSAFYLNTEFRFGENRRLYYTIEPGVEFRYGYTDFISAGGFEENPFGAQIEHSFFYDSVDFFYNSRKGIRTGLTNTVRVVNRNGSWDPVTDLRAEVSPYFAFGQEGRISYYSRAMVLKVFGDTYEQLGEPLRGIPDATMDGDFAFYMNQTIGIGVWKWKGVWDLQIHPFLDVGLATGGTRSFTGWNDIRFSTGADILLFIEKVPNLSFRFSWGVELDPSVSWEDDNKTEFIVRYAYSY